MLSIFYLFRQSRAFSNVLNGVEAVRVRIIAYIFLRYDRRYAEMHQHTIRPARLAAHYTGGRRLIYFDGYKFRILIISFCQCWLLEGGSQFTFPFFLWRHFIVWRLPAERARRLQCPVSIQFGLFLKQASLNYILLFLSLYSVSLANIEYKYQLFRYLVVIEIYSMPA